MHQEISGHTTVHLKISMDFQIKMADYAHIFVLFSTQKCIKMSAKEMQTGINHKIK